MAEPGSGREVTYERLLLEFLLTADPALFASELAENLPVGTTRVNQLLDELEDDGFVTSKHASGRRLFWLTPEGHQYIADVARNRIS